MPLAWQRGLIAHAWQGADRGAACVACPRRSTELNKQGTERVMVLYPLKCPNRQRERRPDVIVRAPLRLLPSLPPRAYALRRSAAVCFLCLCAPCPRATAWVVVTEGRHNNAPGGCEAPRRL